MPGAADSQGNRYALRHQGKSLPLFLLCEYCMPLFILPSPPQDGAALLGVMTEHCGGGVESVTHYGRVKGVMLCGWCEGWCSVDVRRVLPCGRGGGMKGVVCVKQ